ncbi:MAG: hypothetical protein Kow0069_01880 [Promethearchaeota archaeon]
MTTFHVVAKDAAAAWITTLKKVFFEGDLVPTEYDQDGWLPSRDATTLIEVTDPLPEGRRLPPLHPGDLYGVMSVRGGYLAEVLDGTNDQRIWSSETSFPYTYHDRLFAYRPYNVEDGRVAHRLVRAGPGDGGGNSITCPELELALSAIEFPPVDQVDLMICKLRESPHTRRAQGVTWRPLSDPWRDDCPCLQRVWARVIDGRLHFHAAWRSRDLFKAWGANVTAMIMVQKRIADALELPLGSYVDYCDSLHCYGDPKVVREVVRVFETLEKRGELESRYAPLLVEIQSLV